MEEKKYIYDAFISYRHTEPDKFIAENLHKMMEAFKPPKSVLSKENTRKKIERVFRDRDELPLASNLEDPIVHALENSEYLIVICSPRLRESMWCKKEIQTFISLHGRKRVLAVLVEGEPEDSFPEELLYDEVTVTNADGTTSVERVPVEPLAADVRGVDNKARKKALKSEILRLLAPMFNVGYDDLKQRHREQRIKKILTLSIAGGALGLAIGIYSTLTAIQIANQSKQIEAQAKILANNQAEYVAKEAEEYVAKNDRIRAIKTAYSAITEYNGVKMPRTATAERALVDAVGIYNAGYYICPGNYIEMDSMVDDMMLSPNKEKLLVLDSLSRLYLYDVTNNKELFVLPEKAYKNSYGFYNDELIYINTMFDGIKLYSVSDGSEKTGVFNNANSKGYLQGTISNDGRYFVLKDTEKVAVVDAITGDKVLDFSFGKDYYCNAYNCKEDTIYFMGYSTKSLMGDSIVVAVDLKSGNELFRQIIEGTYASNISYTNGTNGEHLLLWGGSEMVLLEAKDGTLLTRYMADEHVAYCVGNAEGNFITYSESGMATVLSGESPYNSLGILTFKCSDVEKFLIGNSRIVGFRKKDNRILFFSYIKNSDGEVYTGEYKEPISEPILYEKATELAKEKKLDKADFVDMILDIPDANLTLVRYSDETMIVYRTSDMVELNTISGISTAGCKYLGKFGDYYLIDGVLAYLIDGNGEVHAEIENLMGVTTDGKRIVVSGRDDNNDRASVSLPVYDTDGVIAKSEKALSKLEEQNK